MLLLVCFLLIMMSLHIYDVVVLLVCVAKKRDQSYLDCAAGTVHELCTFEIFETNMDPEERNEIMIFQVQYVLEQCYMKPWER